jgi:hypothetical protein
MIYGHDYLPAPGIQQPGPPMGSLADLSPSKMRNWAQMQQAATPQLAAGERRIRAWGFGSQRWDPTSTPHLPPGWIRDMGERNEARTTLLGDINDLVSLYE